MCGVQCHNKPLNCVRGKRSGGLGTEMGLTRRKERELTSFPFAFDRLTIFLMRGRQSQDTRQPEEGNLFLRFCFVECTSPVPRLSRNENRISSALDLARKITMYNSRYKTAGIIAQETEFQPSPSLRPRTPVQPYPFFPWQPKGDCLSSTKV